jgi:hypothetical protein
LPAAEKVQIASAILDALGATGMLVLVAGAVPKYRELGDLEILYSGLFMRTEGRAHIVKERANIQL